MKNFLVLCESVINNTLILSEDVQSNKSMAVNILKNSGIQNPDSIASELERIWLDSKEQTPNELKPYNTDSNIPAMAFMYLAAKNNGGNPLEFVRNDYNMYVGIDELVRNSKLSVFVDEIKRKITTEKLFKPELLSKKLEVISDSMNRFVELVHSKNTNVKKTAAYDAANAPSSSDLVYEDNNIKVLLADTRQKCIKYGKGGTLCISASGGGNYFWRYRFGKMGQDSFLTSYFVFFKNGKETVVVEAMGDENGPTDKFAYVTLSNQNETYGLSREEIIKKIPEIATAMQKDIFKFKVPTEEEKIFFTIDDQATSILDPILTEKHHHEMFIETGKKVTEKEFQELENKFHYNKKEMEDLIKKYAFLGENFNIPKSFLSKYLEKADLEKYDEKHLARIKAWASDLLKNL